MARDPHTEADLIRRATEGNRDAFAELIRRYPDVAVATAFTNAFLALPRFRPEGSFRAWLLRIVAGQPLLI